MKPVVLGVAGYGKIARDQHELAIAAGTDFELAAVADPVAHHPVLPSYPDVETMLRAQPTIEAVALCMPPRFRAHAARAAILAGRHVLLEKPPCATLGEAEELVGLARKQGVTLYTAWHSQHGAAVEPALRWLENAAIRSVQIDWKEDVRVWHPGQAWIWQEGGFGVFDPGINALSILSLLLPRALRVIASELEVPSNCLTPIAARLQLEDEGGVPVRAEFDFRQTGPQSWDIRIDTDRGELTLSHGGNRLSVDGEELVVGAEAEYCALFSRFADLICAQESEVDLTPLRLVGQALRDGRVTIVEPFED